MERSCRRRLTDPAFEEGKIVSGLKYGKSEGILQFSGPRNKSEMEWKKCDTEQQKANKGD